MSPEQGSEPLKSCWQVANAEDIKVSGFLLSLMMNQRFAFDKSMKPESVTLSCHAVIS